MRICDHLRRLYGYAESAHVTTGAPTSWLFSLILVADIRARFMRRFGLDG